MSPCPDHHEKYCNEHRGAYIFANKCFRSFQVDTQKRGYGPYGNSILNVLKDFIYLFLEGGEEKKKERERSMDVREKYLYVPQQGWNLQPRHVS